MTRFTDALMDRLASIGQTFKDRLRGTREEGAISAEYVAILLVVAGIVAAVMALNISGAVSSCGDNAKQALFDDSGATQAGEIGGDCAGGGGGPANG